jgi:nucleotide-binding universal stress UspA family protein
MERILVPTDFSEQADYALDLAHQLALELNAEIQLLHVLDVPDGVKMTGMENISFTGESSGNAGMDGIYFYKLMEKTREQLGAIMNRPELKGIKMFEKIQTGSIYRQINEETREGQC